MDSRSLVLQAPVPTPWRKVREKKKVSSGDENDGRRLGEDEALEETDSHGRRKRKI